MEATLAGRETRDDDAIFDASTYDLPIPKLDGRKADKLSLSFGGQVELDRTDEEELELLRQLEFSKELTLTVKVVVAGKGFSWSPRGEDEDQVGYNTRLKVVAVEPAQ